MIKRNIRTTILFLTAVLMISLVSCDLSKKLEKEENNNIQDYLSNNSNLDFVLKTSGLYYLEVVSGTGASPVENDSAFVKYTGMFLDGTVFDSNVSLSTLYGFKVGESIPGFDEGIKLMKQGGKSMFLIPSKLAYGADGKYPYIDGYTPLLFDIELVKVVPAAAK